MNKDLAKFLNVLSIPINGLFSILSFSKYYNVAIKKDVANYLFGLDGPTPYYYRSAELYAAVNLSYAIVFLFVLLLGIWNLKTNKVHGHLILMFTLGLILIQIFHGTIK